MKAGFDEVVMSKCNGNGNEKEPQEPGFLPNQTAFISSSTSKLRYSSVTRHNLKDHMYKCRGIGTDKIMHHIL